LKEGQPPQRAVFEGDPFPPDDRVIHAGPPPIELLYREQRSSLLRFFRRRAVPVKRLRGARCSVYALPILFGHGDDPCGN
jgi:hypothetical protein